MTTGVMVAGLPPRPCPLCGELPSPLVRCDGRLEVYRCGTCKLDAAVHGGGDLATATSQADHFRTIDRDAYDRSVRATREASYPQLLARVKDAVAAGRWLDIGCSFGWLLQHAESSGYVGFGIDPSLAAVAEARQVGLRVGAGMFPDVLGERAHFDVVSLMDVLEHLEDPLSALEQAGRLTADGGVVVLQVPDRDCLLYGCAAAMARPSGGRFGFALERLWLAGFDFPHLWYFTPSALRSMLERAGMEVLELRRIPIGSPRQAMDRVRYTGSNRPLVDGLLAGGVAALNGLDAALGHGGLIEAFARPVRARGEFVRQDRT